MRSSVLRRVTAGFGMNVYGQVVVAIIQLAGVPILLHYWGARLYGVWLILFAIPAYLSITDLGFSISAANDMTARLAQGDKAGVLVVFQSLAALVATMIGLILAAVSMLVFLGPVDRWVHFPNLSAADVQWVLWSLSVGVLVKLFDGVNHAGFRTCGDYALHRGIHFTGLLLQHTAIWIAAFLGFGPRGAAMGFLFVPLIQVPIAALWLRKKHSWLVMGFRYARLHQLRILLRPALANFAVPLAQAVNLQGMILVVGSAMGPVSVVVLSTLRTLTRFVMRLVVAVSEATEPELAAAWGAGDRQLMQRLYMRGLQVAFWLAGGAAVLLAATGAHVLSVWTSGKVEMDSGLFYLLLTSAVLSVLWYGSLTLLKAANRHLRAAIWYVGASILSVVLAEFLLQVRGRLSDAGLALVSMDLLMAAYVLRYAAALANISIMELVRQVVDPRPVYTMLRSNFHVL